MERDEFFGLDFRIKKFDINLLLDLLSIRRKIENLDNVKKITARFGKSSSFLMLSKRQQTLKFLRDLLSDEFSDYDQYYYQKEINTSSAHDRRYNAEDRILEFALIVASGKTYAQLKQEEFKPGLRSLRALRSSERYDRLWDLLSTVESNTIKQFKKALASG